MIDILKQYVPSVPVNLKEKFPGSDFSYITTILIGGEYLVLGNYLVSSWWLTTTKTKLPLMKAVTNTFN